MNILIITGIFPPDIGGPASYVAAVADALARQGHQLSVITLSDGIQPAEDAVYPFQVLRIRRTLPRIWRAWVQEVLDGQLPGSFPPAALVIM